MTVKAGQKCTAIRRTIVPAAIADEVTDAIAARLAKITVGNPTNDDVRMGALASLDQREEVRKAVQALRGSAEIVFGDPDHVDGGRRRRRARRVHVAGPAAGRRRSPRAARRRAVRAGLHGDELRRPRRGHRPRRPRIWLARRLPGHARPGGRAHGDARPRSVARPHPGARPRRRRRVHGPRLAAADARARRTRPRRWRRGARRHPRRAAPHAAHRDPGLARHAHRDHGAVDDRLAAHRDRRAPVPQEPRRPGRRRHHQLGAAARSASTTSSTSRSSPATPSTPTPTRRPPRRTRCSAGSWPTAT